MRPHAFLINLDRSQDRLARCIPLLEQMGISWERVPGIEGAKLPADELARLNPRPAPHGEWFRGLTPGEIGCFLSHIACWRLIAERGLDCALVLEDDFAPDDGFSAERLAAFADSSAHWDVLKLTRIGRNAKLAMPLEHGASIHHIGKGPIDGTGYLVSLAGARKLIQRREHLLRRSTSTSNTRGNGACASARATPTSSARSATKRPPPSSGTARTTGSTPSFSAWACTCESTATTSATGWPTGFTSGDAS
jgi:glycosyl transferase family 25